MKSVVVLGTVVYDQILTARDSILEHRCNKMNLSDSIGGSMHNIAWNLSLLKAETHFISKFGNDELALIAQSELEKHGCFVYGPTLNLATPRFYIMQDDKRTELFCTITDDFFYSPNDPLYIDTINHCHWGITDLDDEAVLLPLISKTPNTQWIISGYVPNYKVISKITGVLLNEHEMMSYLKNRDLDECLDILFNQGLKWIIITRAENGATLYIPNGAYDYPLTKGEASNNSLGCGDAFASGVIYALLQDKTIKEATEMGMKAAQLVLETPKALTENIKKLRPDE